MRTSFDVCGLSQNYLLNHLLTSMALSFSEQHSDPRDNLAAEFQDNENNTTRSDALASVP